jgi:putative ABC transport system permease protein
MMIIQSAKMAFKSILANKMRSLLTMLGIIIGVMSVISLVALGQGTAKQVTDRVQGLGSNLLTVNIIGRGSATVIDYKQAEAFAELEGVSQVAPVISQNATVKYGNESDSVGVTGTNQNYLEVQKYKLASGRFIGQVDLDFRHKVAVLGSATAETLFGMDNPVGSYITINGNRFKVVGVLASKGESMAGSSDEIVIVPITTGERVFRSAGVRTVYLTVENEKEAEAVSERLESRLAEIFRGNTNSYRVFSQQELLETVTSISDTLSLALGGIAAISLIVGGIGIMNIMLVSVTERTREIGVRKAIGAKKRDILLQFLVESVVLSGLGGLLGIAAGVGVAQGLSKAMDVDVVFSPNLMLLAFGFSMAIGVVFGIFPANKAAKLKPIEALRFE